MAADETDDVLSLFTLEGLTADPVFAMLRKSRVMRTDDLTAHDLAGMLGVRAATGSPRQGGTPLDYWEAAQAEFRDFLCGDGGDYADLRQALFGLRGEAQTAMVSVISAAIGAAIGAAAAVIAPLVTLFLLVALRIGRAAYCRLRSVAQVRPFAPDPEAP